MTEMTLILNEKFITRNLEDWELGEFLGSKIDEIGIVVIPVSRATEEELSFEIPFMYKSFKKKTGVFEGILIDGNSKYQLTVNGEMKVKLRPGVVDSLNEHEGGVAMKVGFISRKGKDIGRIIVRLDGQKKDEPISWLEIKDYTIN